jgi:hypothetical protein
VSILARLDADGYLAPRWRVRCDRPGCGAIRVVTGYPAKMRWHEKRGNPCGSCAQKGNRRAAR